METQGLASQQGYISSMEDRIDKAIADLDTALEALESRIGRIIGPEKGIKAETQSTPAVPHCSQANHLESVAEHLERMANHTREIISRIEL